MHVTIEESFDEFVSEQVDRYDCEYEDEYDYPKQVEENWNSNVSYDEWSDYSDQVVKRAEECDVFYDLGQWVKWVEDAGEEEERRHEECEEVVHVIYALQERSVRQADH